MYLFRDIEFIYLSTGAGRPCFLQLFSPTDGYWLFRLSPAPFPPPPCRRITFSFPSFPRQPLVVGGCPPNRPGTLVDLAPTLLLPPFRSFGRWGHAGSRFEITFKREDFRVGISLHGRATYWNFRSRNWDKLAV